MGTRQKYEILAFVWGLPPALKTNRKLNRRLAANTHKRFKESTHIRVDKGTHSNHKQERTQDNSREIYTEAHAAYYSHHAEVRLLILALNIYQKIDTSEIKYLLEQLTTSTTEKKVPK